MSNELPRSADQSGKQGTKPTPMHSEPELNVEVNAEPAVIEALPAPADDAVMLTPVVDAAPPSCESDVSVIQGDKPAEELIELKAEQYSNFDIRSAHLVKMKMVFPWACVLAIIGIVFAFSFNETGFWYPLGFAGAVCSLLLIAASKIYPDVVSTNVILVLGFVVAIVSAIAYFPSGGVQHPTQYVLNANGPYQLSMGSNDCTDTGTQLDPVLTCKVAVTPNPTKPTLTTTSPEKGSSTPRPLEPTLTPSASKPAKSQ